MPGKRARALLAWSSGKDSAWTLHVLREQGQVDVVGLLTTINEAFDRVAARIQDAHTQPTQGTQAGILRCAAADPDDDVAGAEVERSGDRLAETASVAVQGLQDASGKAAQPAHVGQLDDAALSLNGDSRRDRVPERPGDGDRGAVHAGENGRVDEAHAQVGVDARRGSRRGARSRRSA